MLKQDIDIVYIVSTTCIKQTEKPWNTAGLITISARIGM